MKRTRKWIVIAALAAVASLALVGCGGDGADNGDADGAEPFVFANSGAYKPFSFDQGGEIVGFDVDIANEIAERIGRTPEMVSPVPFDTLIQGLRDGRYDALVASHGITDERKEQVDFSRPYYRSGAQTFVAEDNTTITSTDDLPGARIGVVKASTYLALAQDITGEGNVTTYESDIVALQDLTTGRLDAVITDKLVGFIAMDESDLAIKAVGDVLEQDEMGIAVQKGDTELLNAVNDALEEMIADGTYEEISLRWFPENILGE
ncbi:MAG: transporter substrate-binding domain-containing protein [Anaerosomatales bacterium]|nr:transporter substrate-binding domain-containing protein [Anaerosomatales bacterium]MDT8433799.1 transporter substrate-binding domain-containing protein [Anaerosomatales bacterium]